MGFPEPLDRPSNARCSSESIKGPLDLFKVERKPVSGFINSIKEFNFGIGIDLLMS